MKDEFLATLSHELRTPLNAILGWSQVLAQPRRWPTTSCARGLEAIERNARAQTQLIEDLLDMSRIISGKVRLDVQPVDPAAVRRGGARDRAARRPRRRASGCEKLLDPQAGPGLRRSRPAAAGGLEPALQRDQVHAQGRQGRRWCCERVNSHIEISVADTGNGIKPEFLPHVFERFRQADASTTRAPRRPGPGAVDRQAPGRAARRHVARQARARAAAPPSPSHLPLTVGASRATRDERRASRPRSRTRPRPRRCPTCPGSRCWSSTTSPTRAS